MLNYNDQQIIAEKCLLISIIYLHILVFQGAQSPNYQEPYINAGSFLIQAHINYNQRIELTYLLIKYFLKA